MYTNDDADLPFESANDFGGEIARYLTLDPEYDRIPEMPPWESHDWTNDYDYPDDYCPDDEEFE